MVNNQMSSDTQCYLLNIHHQPNDTKQKGEAVCSLKDGLSLLKYAGNERDVCAEERQHLQLWGGLA